MFIVALHVGLALWRLENGLRRFLPSPQRSDPYVHHICGEGTGPLLSIAAKSGSQNARQGTEAVGVSLAPMHPKENWFSSVADLLAAHVCQDHFEWSVGHRQLNLSDSRRVGTWNQSCNVIREQTSPKDTHNLKKPYCAVLLQTMYMVMPDASSSFIRRSNSELRPSLGGTVRPREEELACALSHWIGLREYILQTCASTQAFVAAHMPLGGWGSTLGFLVKELREQRLSAPVEGIHTSDLVGGLLAVRVCHDHFDEVVVVEPEAWIKFPETGRSDPWNQESKRSSDAFWVGIIRTFVKLSARLPVSLGTLTTLDRSGSLLLSLRAVLVSGMISRATNQLALDQLKITYDQKVHYSTVQFNCVMLELPGLPKRFTKRISTFSAWMETSLCFSPLGVGDLPVTLEECKAFT
ncbi:hypothetical protein EV421DRAFT_1736211 [Armillaria borealis]|uniref:Uncharacterized protein n=1 Tax=Armillaria borealis TaxID=47425 RepID=A0AA39JIE4_9AGAR|nr:hypothetical protein EV421DRAFT_1736211 [Armillaria borealis]